LPFKHGGALAVILAIAEVKSGSLSTSSKEVLGMARRIAAQTGDRVAAALVGGKVSTFMKELARWGADVVYVSEHERLAEFQPSLYLKVLRDMAEAARPHTILFPAEGPGMDLAPRLAHRLGAGLVTDCIDFEVRDGRCIFIKPVYGGKALGRLRVTTPIALATIRPRTQEPCPVNNSGAPSEIILPHPIESISPDWKILDRIEEEGEETDLEDAKVVVSGGRGIGGPEGFKPLKQLAKILGGAVGASRTAVDAGWVPPSHQVGQTGKIVAPDVYLAIALSGSSQHVAGMGGSKVIVAINRDPEAPIFRIANLGVVEDYRNVLPALIEEFSRVLHR
jgi:electron transfer flavoprotein alpha subunit